jgi:hypothetical protein
MMNVYKQMTKAIALVALFLIAGVNAWASEQWAAYDGEQQVSITITTSYQQKFVSNMQAKADTQITYSHSGTTGSPENYVGISVPTTNLLYLKPTTDGYLNLRFSCVSGSPCTVTIYDSTTGENVASLNVTVAARTETDVSGDIVLFEVVANHEYEIQSTGKYYLSRVNKYESSEVATVSDEMNATAMQAAIGSGKTIVKMQRTLKAGVWNTFCSPIQLGSSAIKAELKCNEAYELKTYSATAKTITFKRTEVIVAGKPYLIMPTEAVSEITVSNNTNPATYNPQSVTSNGLAFRAALGATNIYTTGDASSTKFYLNAQGKFVYPTSNTGNNGTIKGLRGYFEWTNGVPAHDVKAMTFIFDDDETGIITFEKDIFNENATIYSIDGRNMGNSKENLTRGMYIQNGRKFIVK